MTLKDLAQTDVVTAQPHDDLTTVLEKMRDEEVGCVVIVAEDEPISIVTDRKIALAAADEDIREMPVESLMTDSLVTAQTDMGLKELVDIMHDHAIRRVPIVDNEGSLAGVISMDDILGLLADEFRSLAQIPQQQSEKVHSN